MDSKPRKEVYFSESILGMQTTGVTKVAMIKTQVSWLVQKEGLLVKERMMAGIMLLAMPM